MFTEESEVRPFNVRALCSVEGCYEELVYQNFVYTTYPPQYPHRCSNGHIENLRKVYPLIEYREIK